MIKPPACGPCQQPLVKTQAVVVVGKTETPTTVWRCPSCGSWTQRPMFR